MRLGHNHVVLHHNRDFQLRVALGQALENVAVGIPGRELHRGQIFGAVALVADNLQRVLGILALGIHGLGAEVDAEAGLRLHHQVGLIVRIIPAGHHGNAAAVLLVEAGRKAQAVVAGIHHAHVLGMGIGVGRRGAGGGVAVFVGAVEPAVLVNLEFLIRAAVHRVNLEVVLGAGNVAGPGIIRVVQDGVVVVVVLLLGRGGSRAGQNPVGHVADGGRGAGAVGNARAHINQSKPEGAVNHPVHQGLAVAGQVKDHGAHGFFGVGGQAGLHRQGQVLHHNLHQQLGIGGLPLQNGGVCKIALCLLGGKLGGNIAVAGAVSAQAVLQRVVINRVQHQHVAVMRAAELAVPDVPDAHAAFVIGIQFDVEGELIVVGHRLVVENGGHIGSHIVRAGEPAVLAAHKAVAALHRGKVLVEDRIIPAVGGKRLGRQGLQAEFAYLGGRGGLHVTGSQPDGKARRVLHGREQLGLAAQVKNHVPGGGGGIVGFGGRNRQHLILPLQIEGQGLAGSNILEEIAAGRRAALGHSGHRVVAGRVRHPFQDAEGQNAIPDAGVQGKAGALCRGLHRAADLGVVLPVEHGVNAVQQLIVEHHLVREPVIAADNLPALQHAAADLCAGVHVEEVLVEREVGAVAVEQSVTGCANKGIRVVHIEGAAAQERGLADRDFLLGAVGVLQVLEHEVPEPRGLGVAICKRHPEGKAGGLLDGVQICGGGAEVINHVAGGGVRIAAEGGGDRQHVVLPLQVEVDRVAGLRTGKGGAAGGRAVRSRSVELGALALSALPLLYDEADGAVRTDIGLQGKANASGRGLHRAAVLGVVLPVEHGIEAILQLVAEHHVKRELVVAAHRLAVLQDAVFDGGAGYNVLEAGVERDVLPVRVEHRVTAVSVEGVGVIHVEPGAVPEAGIGCRNGCTAILREYGQRKRQQHCAKQKP